MKYDADRMARSQLYVDRAVRWINEAVPTRYASPIIHQGYPDQGDAITWKLKEDEQKYHFRTIDAKEAHQWTETAPPPKSWGGLMLTTEKQLHPSWIYIVINNPMTMLAYIDMEQWSTTIAQKVETQHPEFGTQVSMKMPFKCFKFLEIPQ